MSSSVVTCMQKDGVALHQPFFSSSRVHCPSTLRWCLSVNECGEKWLNGFASLSPTASLPVFHHPFLVTFAKCCRELERRCGFLCLSHFALGTLLHHLLSDSLESLLSTRNLPRTVVGNSYLQNINWASLQVNFVLTMLLFQQLHLKP